MGKLGAVNVQDEVGSQATEPVRGEKYYNLISFIVSNAVAGELTAVNNYSEMVHLAPDLETKLHLLRQAQEEAGHVKTLTALCNRLGIPVANRIVEPEWHRMRESFSAAAHRGDLAACVIMQDVMIETMAIVLYRTLAGLESANTDAETTRVAKALLDDEMEHLAWGNETVRSMAAADPEKVHDALVWAHHRTMPEMFGLIRNGCDTLCDVLGVECGSFGVEEMSTDLDTLRMTALDTYIESLDRAGFEPKVTAPLIASMSAYEGMPRASVGAQAGACAPESGCC
jgi:fatty aldehyde decarbonylase